MQTEAWAMLGTALTGMATGGVGVAKAYFHYRVRIIELQNQRDHEIEDRRQNLEDTRKKTNEAFLKDFKETVTNLGTELKGLKDRLDTLEPKVESIPLLDRDVKILSEKMDRVNSWFERVKGQGGVKEIAPGVLRVSEEDPGKKG